MCEWKKHGDTRIDPCMRMIVKFINRQTNYTTIMCCCGHGKYPPTLIVMDTKTQEKYSYIMEIFSETLYLNNPKRFYKRDEEGHYYIPETI